MFDQLIDNLKSAARGDNAEAKVKALLAEFVRDPKQAKSAMPVYQDDDVIIFEDDAVSIWFCRFQPGAVVPPHDHQMSATIGVYQGTEQNDLYDRDDQDLPVLKSSTAIPAGQVVQIAEKAIHGVTCTSAIPSEALHVYLGTLTTVERSIFDVAAGKEMLFTEDNYNRLISR